MRKLFFLGFCLLLFIQAKNPTEAIQQYQQPQSEKDLSVAHPKLVVGIIVDQMRYDYLTRFWNRFGDDGFKRLIGEGYLMQNTHYNYMPTYTAPGHTSVFTGSTPRFHGIIANDWYDKNQHHFVNAVFDPDVEPVGNDLEENKRSPVRLLATTLADQNRLATQFRGKSIGVSLKDRAAILPVGRSANGAFWFSGKDGKFVTSTFYMNELPKWVTAFNQSKKADSYIKEWNTLYPIDTYRESGTDLNTFEGKFKGMDEAVFPYDVKQLKEKYQYEILKRVPYGNSLTVDFAMAAIDGEDLGKDEETDFLTISFSAPDYIGHQFGVNSKEVEDNYLRLDQDLARLLKALDKKVGKGNYTLFLTADHAGGHVPNYLKSKKFSAGYYGLSDLRKKVNEFLLNTYGVDSLVENISNFQVFLNYEKLAEHKIDRNQLSEELKFYLQNYPLIAQVYTRNQIENADYTGMVSKRIKNGFNPKRSGDLMYVLEPEVISGGDKSTGSTHGSPYTYDTHVPLIFYGAGIRNGSSYEPAEITDIAPTISALLGNAFPNSTFGKVLIEVLNEKKK